VTYPEWVDRVAPHLPDHEASLQPGAVADRTLASPGAMLTLVPLQGLLVGIALLTLGGLGSTPRRSSGQVVTIVAHWQGSPQDPNELRERSPNIRTLGFVDDPEEIGAFVQVGVGMVRVWPDWIRGNSALLDRIHLAGRPVWVTAGAAPRVVLEVLIAAGADG